VAVVWRSQQRQLQYDWLPDGWAAEEPDAELSRQRLTLLIEDSLRSRDVLPYSMEMMADLIDENRGVSHFSSFWFKHILFNRNGLGVA
jgi:hypothetical protein